MKHFLLPLIGLFLLFSLPVTLHAKEQKVAASYLKLPLYFVKNEGQKHKDILFYEQGNGHITAFTKEGISLVLSKLEKIKEEKKHPSPEVVSLKPVTTSPFTIESLDKKEGKVNCLIGNDPSRWKTDIPTYGAILYKNVYLGIDMKFYGTNTHLEYDIIVSPKADPSQIRLSYKGIEKLSLSSQGELEILLKEGKLLQKKPVIYQTINGERREVEGEFVLVDATTYGFEVGTYDKSQPLVIDPVLVYSTYLGGSNLNHPDPLPSTPPAIRTSQAIPIPPTSPLRIPIRGLLQGPVTPSSPSSTRPAPP